ncbi:MAG: outer membrane beta-barrel protein [Roseimicrobium sp.]
MKFHLSLLFAGALTAAATAHGQGLLSIGQKSDYPESTPLTFNVGAGAGYERTHYSSSPGLQDLDSYFINGGVGLIYGVNEHTTKWNVGAVMGVIRYLDDVERSEDLYYNARVSFNFSHEFSRRLSVSDNLYFTYEIEPDFNVGATSGRRAGQYIYGYNNASVAYAWSERMSTTTGYTIEGIRYTDDDIVGQFEDRTSHTLSQQVSYALNRTTKLVGEYRFRYTDFENTPKYGDVALANPDYMSHYILIGVDQAWSDRANASLRAGAEFYQSDRSDEIAPYVEASLDYAISRRTNARVYAQAGFDASELGAHDSRYSIRAGATASHQFTEKLSGSAGLHFVHSEFNGSGAVDSSSDNEVNATIGLNYNLWQNVSIDAGYSYTTIASDAEFRDYDRHRVNLGVNASF